MTRFVILHHRLADGEHWDLMLEHQGTLLTWQLLSEPQGLESLPIAARRIENHRLAYLDYEGPISGNRGNVRRVEAGDVQVEQLDDSLCVFSLHGDLLVGRFRLVESESGWTLERQGEND